MKRIPLLLGAVVALLGSLGLFMFGGAVVGVFDILAYRFVEPRDPPPAALAELRWAVMSALALMAGAVISCAAMVKRDRQQAFSPIGRMLCGGAGVSLIVGAMTLAWVIIGVRARFQVIATAESPPTIQSIQSAAPEMGIGYGMFVLSAVLWLAAAAGFQTRSSAQAAGTRTPFGVAVVIGSLLVGLVVLLLTISIWFNGAALEIMVSENSIPRAADLAEHLVGVLNKSILLFGGMAALGLLQLLASLIPPLSKPDTASDISA